VVLAADVNIGKCAVDAELGHTQSLVTFLLPTLFAEKFLKNWLNFNKVHTKAFKHLLPSFSEGFS